MMQAEKSASSPHASPHPAVFLDRDDTILDTHAITANDPIPGDLYDPTRVRLMPGAASALASLKAAGFVLVIFTSQGGVARGSGTLRDTEAVNDELRRQLALETRDPQLITATYYCPMHPTGTVTRFAREHPWRKPAPGMILAAASELNLDLSRSWAIGDKPRDVQAGAHAGIHPSRTLLLRTSGEAGAFADLAEAAKHVLRAAN